MARTILTIAQQKEWYIQNFTTWEHHWSTRGCGKSTIKLPSGDTVATAHGCGYDRYGRVLGNAIEEMFPAELRKLAQKECKTPYSNAGCKKSDIYHGLFYAPKEKRAYIDGAYGSEAMRNILNRIGFSIKFIGEANKSSLHGVQFYEITPVEGWEKKRVRSVK